MKLALLVLALAGCDTVFSLERGIDAAPEGLPQVCPASYTLINNGYYRIDTTPTSWLDAETACVADGQGLGMSTHLAVLGSTTELNDLYDAVHQQLNDYAWVGMSNRAHPPANCTAPIDYGFEWVTNEPAPVPMAHQPPWNSLDPMNPCTQPCVRILTNPQLDNSSCVNKHTFICECDAFPEDPARR